MQNTIEETFSRAVTFHREGNLGEAEKLYRAVLDADPEYAEALNLLGVLASDHGYHDDAVEMISQAIELQPKNPFFLFSLGNTLLRQNLYEDAEYCYRRSLELDPAEGAANQNLAAVLRDQGKYAEAVEAAARAVGQMPDSIEALHLYAEILLYMGRHSEGVEVCQKAVDLEPNNPAAHALLGNALKNVGNLDGAMTSFNAGLNLKFGLNPHQQSGDPLFTYTTPGKLDHDIRQFKYLIEKGLLGDEYKDVVTAYSEVLNELRAANPDGQETIQIPPHLLEKIAPVYNRLSYQADASKIDGPAVNPDLDGAALEALYQESGPGYVCVDDFLTPEALQKLRDYCLQSTIWFHFRYANGRVSAEQGSGFFTPLLSQISDELSGLMPNVFLDHKLNQAWGYKYSTDPQGITEHADFAAVNINFWITPDEANNDPDSGGLVVWDKAVPMEWTFAEYQDPLGLRKFLKQEEAQQIVFPYRQNRVLIFNSNLVHMTDRLDFKPRYENHRINVTMLYGDRKTA